MPASYELLSSQDKKAFLLQPCIANLRCCTVIDQCFVLLIKHYCCLFVAFYALGNFVSRHVVYDVIH